MAVRRTTRRSPMNRARIRLPEERIADFCRRHHIRRLALVRLLEIVGEAARRVSAARQARHPDIAWPQIVGFRNRMIHGYDSVNMTRVWEIVTHDLPALEVSLARILEPGDQP